MFMTQLKLPLNKRSPHLNLFKLTWLLRTKQAAASTDPNPADVSFSLT